MNRIVEIWKGLERHASKLFYKDQTISLLVDHWCQKEESWRQLSCGLRNSVFEEDRLLELLWIRLGGPCLVHSAVGCPLLNQCQ